MTTEFRRAGQRARHNDQCLEVGAVPDPTVLRRMVVGRVTVPAGGRELYPIAFLKSSVPDFGYLRC